LFQPFVSTKGEAGTGLGLASCRRIIEEEHGGKIALEPAASGTTFRIELPR
jgi:signal transduction histidine kinase